MDLLLDDIEHRIKHKTANCVLSNTGRMYFSNEMTKENDSYYWNFPYPETHHFPGEEIENKYCHVCGCERGPNAKHGHYCSVAG